MNAAPQGPGVSNAPDGSQLGREHPAAAAPRDIERIRKGIAGYAKEQRIILRLLRRFGPFTEKDFDRWLEGREWRRPRFRARGITGDTFLLGLGVNGFNLWAEWLELMQYMMVLGLIDAKTEDGLVVYRLAHGARIG